MDELESLKQQLEDLNNLHHNTNGENKRRVISTRRKTRRSFTRRIH